MAYIQYFVDLLEKTNNANIFKCVTAVFLIWFVCSLYTILYLQEFSVKGLKNSCLFGLIYAFIFCILFLWLDIARFYSINKIFAFIAFLALLICIVAIMRAVKKRRIRKSVVVAAPPPTLNAILEDIEPEEKEKK